MMKIGIIGSGNVGGTLGRLWATAGHQVMFSFSRHPERLQALAIQIGTNAIAGTPLEASNFADVILFAPNFWLAEEAIHQTGSLIDKVVIDTTNPYRWENNTMKRMVDENISGVEILQKLVPEALWVKAFSSFQPSALQHSAARSLTERLAVAIASDHQAAKETVAQLAQDSGGRPFDLGALRNARLMEIPGPFSFSDDLTLEAALDRRRQVLSS
jgi:predicted dinucleotide-binding enzyme